MPDSRNITEVESFNFRYLIGSKGELVNNLFGETRDFEVILTNSGKAALHIILSYYRSVGRIKNKNEELWVPQWIGAWVYNIVQKVCFPSITKSDRTRGILIYHQYGFPQKLEKLKAMADEHGWFVIEDCAHAIKSYDSGKRLGLTGDAGIFSFSKFFPSVMGGALVTRDPKLAEFARGKVANNSVNGTIISSIAFFSKWAQSSNRFVFFKRIFGLFVEMTYAVYDEIPKMHPLAYRIVSRCLSMSSLTIRDENRNFFLDELRESKVFDSLNLNNITPYVLPLILEVEVLQRISDSFKQIGVVCGIYHFDLNQDMSDSNFVKCLWIPVHPGISQALRKEMVLAIKREMR